MVLMLAFVVRVMVGALRFPVSSQASSLVFSNSSSSSTIYSTTGDAWQGTRAAHIIRRGGVGCRAGLDAMVGGDGSWWLWPQWWWCGGRCGVVVVVGRMPFDCFHRLALSTRAH